MERKTLTFDDFKFMIYIWFMTFTYDLWHLHMIYDISDDFKLDKPLVSMAYTIIIQRFKCEGLIL